MTKRVLSVVPSLVAEPSRPVVSGHGLHKVYGTGGAGVPALRGVDIDVAPGELVAVMGPSGSGKTSLVHLLSGLDEPTAGQVWFEGRHLATIAPDELASLRATAMGFVLQRDNLVPSLSLRENVALPLALAGHSWGPALRRADEALEQVKLDHRSRAWPSDVSGGEAQRAAVARACIAEPAVIFADEPTGALDTGSGITVLSLFRTMISRYDTAGILVTHDPGVGEVADRVVVLRDGVVVDG